MQLLTKGKHRCAIMDWHKLRPQGAHKTLKTIPHLQPLQHQQGPQLRTHNSRVRKRGHASGMVA